jgi:hypothetical protein
MTKGRPKGSTQARNESKYWLPEGVTFKSYLDQPSYTKEHILLFEDSEFGEFHSSFRAIQGANASTHPLAVKRRRENTNLKK